MSPAGLRLPIAAVAAALFLGTAAAEEAENVLADPSPDWTVGVAAFDTSSMGASSRLAGDLLAGDLAAAVSGVSERTLPDAERNAYAAYLRALSVEKAAADLASKRSARDALFYAGHHPAKYRSEVTKAEESLAKARSALDAALAVRAQVAVRKPVLAAKENADGALIAPPERGGERAFCLSKKIDALLLGSAEEYYGRTYVSVRLYSPYLLADLYADSAVFSTEHREAALAELRGRLAAAVSGSAPARIAVTVEPPDADVLIGGKLAGRGTLEEREIAPGKLSVEASAPGYGPFAEEIPVESGESVTLRISLPRAETTPISVAALGAEAFGSAPNLYVGGLYVGTAPTMLEAPLGSSLSLFAEVPGALDASLIVSAPLDDGEAELSLGPIADPKAKPVEDARKAFYGAFARFSIMLPIAFIASGIASSYRNAAIAYNSYRLGEITVQTEYIAGGLWSLTGIFACESIYRFIRYLRNSDARAVKREG